MSDEQTQWWRWWFLQLYLSERGSEDEERAWAELCRLGGWEPGDGVEATKLNLTGMNPGEQPSLSIGLRIVPRASLRSPNGIANTGNKTSRKRRLS